MLQPCYAATLAPSATPSGQSRRSWAGSSSQPRLPAGTVSSGTQLRPFGACPLVPERRKCSKWLAGRREEILHKMKKGGK